MNRQVLNLVIEHLGGSELGRCYYSMSYKITSTQKISKELIKLLHEEGFLGYGQEFSFRETSESGPDSYIYLAESRVDSSD